MKPSVFFLLLLSIGIVCNANGHDHNDNEPKAQSSSSTKLPNSCENLNDGYELLKLNPTDPIVYTRCSQGFYIIDVNLDSSFTSLFSSWMDWHHSISGPTKSDTVNWKYWYHPRADDDNMIMYPSPNCDTCDLDVIKTQDINGYDIDINQGYYMSATTFGCNGRTVGVAICDWDFFSYQCYRCASSEISAHEDRVFTQYPVTNEKGYLGTCGIVIDTVDTTNIAHDYQGCSMQLSTSKPSIGIVGKYCMCAKPSTTSYFDVTDEEWTEKNKWIEDNKNKNVNSDNNNFKITSHVDDGLFGINEDDLPVYHLYQKDFTDGTYRIVNPGKYIIEEDIIFSFKENYDEPNGYGAWTPTVEEIDAYPGAGQSSDPYYLGFFAGITIETDNVILELNKHEIKQSFAFSIQQGFFALIECGSQPFLPGNGIGLFGAHPKLPSNIIIRNGKLGLSSHHGIHGNFNSNVKIENIQIYDFGTHGIQFNGFTNVILKNIEIGPSSEQAYISSSYTEARSILSIAKQLSEDETISDIVVPLSNYENGVTVKQAVERLENQMDMIFNYLVNNVNYDETNTEWIAAKKLFLKSDSLPYGSAMYGIFLNSPLSSISSYHLNAQRSHDATLENIYIHDLQHNTFETISIQTGADEIQNVVSVFGAPFEATHVFGMEYDALPKDISDHDDIDYVGNALYDFFFVQYNVSNHDWAQLGITKLNDEFLDWIYGYKPLSEVFKFYRCNFDAMSHPLKGLVGLRIDGVNNVVMNNVKVENLIEASKLGSSMCGKYDYSPLSNQHLPFQIGYSGNMLQGISIDYSTVTMQDIFVNNLESKTGLSAAISLWYGSEIEMKNKIQISNIVAGSIIEKDSFTTEDRPNHAPESCAIRVIDLINNDELPQVINLDETCQINIECIDGHVGCDGNEKNYLVFNKKTTFKQCATTNEYIVNDRKISSIFDTIFFTNTNIIIIEIFLVCCLLWYVMYFKVFHGCCKHEKYSYTRL